MNNLLAVETSTENCSCALLKGEQIYAVERLAPQQHAELLLSMVDEVLSQASLPKSALDGIVLGAGPGSFTGVRIATACAQALSCALNLPVARVSSLKALAFEALLKSEARYALSCIDARMQEVYLAFYQKQEGGLQCLISEQVLPPERALQLLEPYLAKLDEKALVLGGSGIDLLYNAGLNKNFKKNSLFPSAQTIVKIGRSEFDSHAYVDASEALPLYVRNEVAWKKLDQQLKTKP